MPPHSPASPHGCAPQPPYGRFAGFLDALTLATAELREPEQIMQLTARMLGEAVGANRCAYANVEADQDHFDLVGDYNDGVRSIVGHYAFSAFGAEVLRLMRAGLPYVNDDVDSDARTRDGDLAAYRLTEIQAVICVPLVREGRFVAAMAVHQKVPRRWEPDEVALLPAVVERCWETLERLRAEKQLRQAHERLSLAMSAAELGAWSWDAATDLLELSDRAADIFGVPRGQSFTRTWMRALLVDQDQQEAARALRQALETGGYYSLDYRLRRPDGGVRWVAARGRPLPGADGRVVAMSGTVQDITAVRTAQEAIRAEAEALELLNHTGAVLSSQLELDQLVRQATEAAVRLVGAGCGLFITLDGDSRAQEHLYCSGTLRTEDLSGILLAEAPAAAAEALRSRLNILRDLPAPEGGRPPVLGSLMATPIVSRTSQALGCWVFGHAAAGGFDGRAQRLAHGVAAQTAIALDNARLYAQVQRDAAEKVALLESERAARAEAERANHAKDEFLATLSHELRTPLSAIRGWVHILRRRLPPGAAECRRGVEVIDRSVTMQTQLIDDLLDMGRIGSGKLRLDVEAVDLARVVAAAADTVRPAAEAAGVLLHLSLHPPTGLLWGDPGRLQQVVWNLLANAIKFSKAGTTVRVELRQAGGMAEIQVADQGEGIDPAFVPHLFERFRQADGSITRRHGGLGLGLSIARSLVEYHGGSMGAHSAGRGLGATFTVRLPLSADAAPAAGAPAAGGPAAVSPSLAGCRVLLVDDDGAGREVVRHLLADAGAMVHEAAGALQALALLESSLGAGTPPDVVVTDLGMPEVDGYAFLRRLRTLPALAATPVLALTAFARAEDAARTAAAGFFAHVTKPVEAHRLLCAVADATAPKMPTGIG